MELEDSPYASVQVSFLYDYVIPEIPGFVTSLVDQHIRQAARRFFRRTRSWRKTLSPIDIEEGKNQYKLQDPTNAEIWEVARVTYDGKLIHPSADEITERELESWRTKPGVPTAYHFYNASVIVLNRVPEADIPDGLKCEAWVQPSINATTLPGVVRKYADVIGMGAKATLMLMGRKPWTDRELGTAYWQEFNRATSKLALRVAKGGARMPLRSRPVYGIEE